MNETLVTVQGYVGSEPEERIVGDAVVASFRVGSTPRRFNKKDNAWVDQETSWYTVNAWRGLGKNILTSIRMREPVVVYGRLRAQVWTDNEGKPRTNMIIEALTVGHDLNRGTSAFLKSVPTGGDIDDAELAALNAQLSVGGEQITSDGDLIDDDVSARDVA